MKNLYVWRSRYKIFTYLQTLPQASLVEHDEIMIFIETNQLMGKGLGYIDIALLASSVITGIPFWTLDQKLNFMAKKFNLDYLP